MGGGIPGRKEIERKLKAAHNRIEVHEGTIARLRRTLDELRADYDRYRTAFEQAAIGVIRVGLNGNILQVNGYMCEMLGYSNQELCKLAIIDITHRDEHEKDLRINELALNRNVKTFDLIRRYLHKDGHVIWAATAVSLVCDDIGRPNYFLAIVHDISQLRNTADALSAREATLNSLLDVAPIGIGIVKDEILEAVNNSFCNLIGYESDELVGRSIETIFSSREAYHEAYARAQETLYKNRSCAFETRYRRRNGTEIDVFVSCTFIVPGDLSSGVIFTALDITERKHAQSQLQIKAEEISEANTALKVLLEHKERASVALKEDILVKIDLVIQPHLELLRSGSLSRRQSELLDLLSRDLDSVFAPIVGPGVRAMRNLTPMQAKVANLIKNGKSTKEIADILHLSTKAVSYHRGNLRQIFRLTGQKRSLQAFLMGLEE